MNREEAKQQAEELVAQMTIDEKASQLRYDAPAIERLGIPAYNWWNEALHGLARGGTATSFPQAIGLAAMFCGKLRMPFPRKQEQSTMRFPRRETGTSTTG